MRMDRRVKDMLYLGEIKKNVRHDVCECRWDA